MVPREELAKAKAATAAAKREVEAVARGTEETQLRLERLEIQVRCGAI